MRAGIVPKMVGLGSRSFGMGNPFQRSAGEPPSALRNNTPASRSARFRLGLGSRFFIWRLPSRGVLEATPSCLPAININRPANYQIVAGVTASNGGAFCLLEPAFRGAKMRLFGADIRSQIGVIWSRRGAL